MASDPRIAIATANLVAKPPIHPPSFDTLKPDRTDEIFLYDESQPDLDCRYRIRVIDRPLSRSNNGRSSSCLYHTAVFLIPAGRESEYLFQQTGLRAIAESAQTARLLAVSFGRRHVFVSQEAVQAELTYVVQVLSRQGQFCKKFVTMSNGSSAEIPFMALDGIGERNSLAEGETDISGRYLVEQVQVGERTVRRLYFTDNPFVIQSEVYLRDSSSGGSEKEVDKSVVAFEYHKSVVAGLLSLGSVQQGQQQGLLVGLGGGGLVNFCRYLLPDLKMVAVELDGGMVQVAQTYFGLEAESEHLSIRVGNGLHVCAPARADQVGDDSSPICYEALDWVVLDVDSKDKTVGMSCPPQAFVETAYLEQLKGVLRDTGILAINVSARDPKMLPMVCRQVKAVFPTVFLCASDEEEETGDSKEDINVVLFATCSQLQLAPIDELRDRLTAALPSTVDEVVVGDLVACLDEISEWTEQSNEGPKSSGKKKPKRRKRGKKK